MNNIIICDTREKGNDYILKYFTNNQVDYKNITMEDMIEFSKKYNLGGE